MGICESTTNKPPKTEVTTDRAPIIINQPTNTEKTQRIPETIIDDLKPFIDLDPNTSKILSKKICRIIIEVNGKKIEGTGFFLAIPIDLEWFYCLMTNDHLISNESINNNNIIYITYEGYKSTSIKLQKGKRYIESFKEQHLDITVVQLLEDDNISKECFLLPELDIPINKGLINYAIYIPQYIKDEGLKNAIGTIKNISIYEITHLANTIRGSSGSPIFLKNSNKVIGIHKEGAPFKKENYGDFIYPIINMIKEDIRIKRNNGKYINDKYIYDDGKYYIGEIKNNLPNGKGIKYYQNGKINYEGYFINGKFEGNGKLFYEDGAYYIGQFKNGLSNGKGTDYNSKGIIKYYGDYVNDKFEGNGKYIWEDGDYYIGQWKNGLKHGKGTEYYKNGNIKYDGDFVNHKAEGNGKYIWEDGDYYIGQWKNDLKHGKGTYYYKNGNIKYNGNWNNNIFVEN